jgi:molybdopterin converting factor small subunit
MPLRKFIDGRPSTPAKGTTLRQIIDDLDATYPGIKELLIDPELESRVIRSMSAIIDGEMADLGLRTEVGENSEVHFIPAIAGGCR